MNCGWLKETFWQYVTINGFDKCDVSKYCEENPSPKENSY